MVTQKESENVDILELRSRKVNRNTCRALWPVNHEQVKRDLEKEHKKMTKHYTEKYNFDFESGRPIDGKWKWEREDSSHSESRQKRPSTLAKRQGGKSAVDSEDYRKKAKRSEKYACKESFKSPSKLKKSRIERENPTKRKPGKVKGTGHSR